MTHADEALEQPRRERSSPCTWVASRMVDPSPRSPRVSASSRVEVFVPQDHAPGAEAEVDFGEVWVVLAGVRTKCHMFTFRLSHSGKAAHRVYSTQGAFLEGPH